ncbi:hypothetical protein LTR97_005084 [Elasticomyces elasticus]|uniref:F-box domain-containing protein n=1 Tax=Elasticomyces elasticus TaxID=574655 RepID=A0AAN7WCL3_9PEZI|nr:hypothetical protein LTR97_005084 [Elasticomyces elasticus]
MACANKHLHSNNPRHYNNLVCRRPQHSGEGDRHSVGSFHDQCREKLSTHIDHTVFQRARSRLTGSSPPLELDRKMATTAALAVVELLESILVNLDFHDLLAARAVSKQWRSATSQSLALRRILFLAPMFDTMMGVDMEASRSSHELHAVTLTAQRYGYDTHPLSLPTSYSKMRRSINANSAMGSVTCVPYASIDSVPESYICVFKWLVEAMRRVPESEFCKSMYLTEPPCTAVELYIRPSYEAFQGLIGTFSSATLRVQNGIKLGMIVATAEDMLEHLEVQQGMEVFIRFQG